MAGGEVRHRSQGTGTICWGPQGYLKVFEGGGENWKQQKSSLLPICLKYCASNSPYTLHTDAWASQPQGAGTPGILALQITYLHILLLHLHTVLLLLLHAHRCCDIDILSETARAIMQKAISERQSNSRSCWLAGNIYWMLLLPSRNIAACINTIKNETGWRGTWWLNW